MVTDFEGNAIAHFALLESSQFTFSNNPFRKKNIKVSNSLNPEQARRNVGPDLSPNCLQRIYIDCTDKRFICLKSVHNALGEAFVYQKVFKK